MSTTDIIGHSIGLLACIAIIALVWFAPALEDGNIGSRKE